MNIKQSNKWITKWWGMWLVFFLYTAAAGAFVQLVLLPFLLPGMHYGHGLFVPDSTGFHQVAKQQAAAMMKYGWKAWQLRPNNFYPAGIASIFYYLWYPEPISLIPFNAVLHATAGCLVFFLLFSFVQDRIAAFGGAALFVLNPASLEWTSQIHRDGTFILGNLLVLSAWLLVLKGIDEEKWRKFIYSVFIFFIGASLMSVVRPYWGQVVEVACACLTAVIFFQLIVSLGKDASKKIHHVAAVLVVSFMLVMQIVLAEKNKVEFAPPVIQAWDDAVAMMAQKGKQHEIEWRFSPFIPRYIESKLYILAQVRWAAATMGGGSLIDPEVEFESSNDFLLYLPRSLEVGFLSPFPSMCFSPGKTAGTTAGRVVLGILTMFFYICIAFFVRSLRMYWKNRNFWLVVLYSIFGVLVFTYTYPNVGVLNRLRYCFYMTIVSAGFAVMTERFMKSRESRRRDIV